MFHMAGIRNRTEIAQLISVIARSKSLTYFVPFTLPEDKPCILNITSIVWHLLKQ